MVSRKEGREVGQELTIFYNSPCHSALRVMTAVNTLTNQLPCVSLFVVPLPEYEIVLNWTVV